MIFFFLQYAKRKIKKNHLCISVLLSVSFLPQCQLLIMIHSFRDRRWRRPHFWDTNIYQPSNSVILRCSAAFPSTVWAFFSNPHTQSRIVFVCCDFLVAAVGALAYCGKIISIYWHQSRPFCKPHRVNPGAEVWLFCLFFFPFTPTPSKPPSCYLILHNS